MYRWSFFHGFLTYLVVTSVKGLGILDLIPDEESEDYQDNDISENERFLIIPTFQVNLSNIAASGLPIALALTGSILSIVGTVALAAILFSLFAKLKYDDGYGYNHGSGYSSYRAYFDPTLIDWEKSSIVDLINVGEEVLTNFEPTNTDCQKRLICEIHRDTKLLGFAAQKTVELFKYLYYVSLASLPGEVEELVEQYLDAANLGKSKENCNHIFSNCRFSVTKLVKDFNHKTITVDNNHI